MRIQTSEGGWEKNNLNIRRKYQTGKYEQTLKRFINKYLINTKEILQRIRGTY